MSFHFVTEKKMENYSCHQKNQFIFLYLVMIQLSMLISISTSFDPKLPPKPVKEVCHRTGRELYWYCISVFNTGSAENGDMRFLSYYTLDFAENNATNALDRINSTLIPGQADPYVQEVLNVCKDAFTRMMDVLTNRVNPMLVETGRFEEAKAWVNYGIGLMDCCRAVCDAKPNVVCPLKNNVRDTHDALKLLGVVLQLLTEGIM